MKQMYEEPAIVIIKWVEGDVVTTSGGGAAILPDDEF